MIGWMGDGKTSPHIEIERRDKKNHYRREKGVTENQHAALNIVCRRGENKSKTRTGMRTKIEAGGRGVRDKRKPRRKRLEKTISKQGKKKSKNMGDGL